VIKKAPLGKTYMESDENHTRKNLEGGVGRLLAQESTIGKKKGASGGMEREGVRKRWGLRLKA